MAHTFRFELLTPEGVAVEADATSAILPARDGLLGVLPGRADLVAALGGGPATVRTVEGERVFSVQGGLAHMKDNVLTLLPNRWEEGAERPFASIR